MASITRFSSKFASSCQHQRFIASSMRNSSFLPAATTGRFQPLQETSSLQRTYQLTAVRCASDNVRDAYEEKKRALKALRTQRYEERQARKEKVKHRRDGKPKNQRKNIFEAWFRKKQHSEEINNHKAKKLGMDFKINVAVVLERLPIVLPDKFQWEKDYDNLRAYLDQFGRSYPTSLMGEHEIEELEELTDEAFMEKHLPRGFTPAPRETEADDNGNVRTLERRLKTWVYLTVKDSETWQFPTVEVKGDETLLDAAKRAVQEKVGGALEIYYPSNCPMAVDMQVYDKEIQKQQNLYGEKTFFMVVQYDDGKVAESDMSVDDFAWLEKSEFVDRVKEEQGEEKSKLYQYLLTTA